MDWAMSRVVRRDRGSTGFVLVEPDDLSLSLGRQSGNRRENRTGRSGLLWVVSRCRRMKRSCESRLARLASLAGTAALVLMAAANAMAQDGSEFPEEPAVEGIAQSATEPVAEPHRKIRHEKPASSRRTQPGRVRAES